MVLSFPGFPLTCQLLLSLVPQASEVEDFLLECKLPLG